MIDQGCYLADDFNTPTSSMEKIEVQEYQIEQKTNHFLQ